MGCVSGKMEKENVKLRERIVKLEDEIHEIRCKREQERKAYDQCVALLATKEVGWRKQWRKSTEEISALKRRLEEGEEEVERKNIVDMTAVSVDDVDAGWHQQLTSFYLVEQMKAEQIKSEEAAGKWKKLYHTIKNELDELIHRTHEGEMLFWKKEEEMDNIRMELKLREDTLRSLKSRLASVEEEGVRREREMDILRQSIRILRNAKRSGSLK